MQLPLTFSLQPSRRLAVLLAAVHLGAVAATLALALPWWIRLLLLSAILASAWRQWLGLTGKGRICRLTLRGDGRLEFARVDGSGGEARIHPQTTVISLLAVLLLRREGRIEALVVMPDALDAEDFRRLRLWLRWCAAGAAE